MIAFRGPQREGYPCSFRSVFVCQSNHTVFVQLKVGPWQQQKWRPLASLLAPEFHIVAMSALTRYLAREAEVALGL